MPENTQNNNTSNNSQSEQQKKSPLPKPIVPKNKKRCLMRKIKIIITQLVN